jgi:flavin reductase (DIM6/NTAB) family NADH-FMN oxidoreductase RutF
MPARQPLNIYDLLAPAFGLWDQSWLLLTAGTFTPARPAPPGTASKPTFNSMTVSWGGLGYMWSKPLAMVVVRPQRYTFQFMETSPDFTLCVFPESCRDALNLLGTQSGRESDKIAASGLTPMAVPSVRSPAFAEAELVLACRKTYWQDLDPKHFLADYIAPNYRDDYHRIYFGEVLHVEATARWSAAVRRAS